MPTSASVSQYLVITAKDDAHLALVEPHLDKPFIRLNPAEVITGGSISYLPDREGIKVIYNDVLLQNISSVWLRKPTAIGDLALPVAKHLQPYAAEALRHFTKLVYTRFADALWVSDHYAVARASDKVLQLELANRLGFKIPKTIVTSSSAAAKQFVDEQKGAGIVVKPIEGTTFTLPDGTAKLVVAHKMAESDNTTQHYAGLHLAPSIFQCAVDRDADVRVTVVGDKVFAATLRPTRPADVLPDVCVLNMEMVNDNLTIEPIELPKKIAALCIAHVKELGLNFGAIDLVLDKKGDYWFLENNPNGQWGFVEYMTGQPIGKAMAELLMRGKR